MARAIAGFDQDGRIAALNLPAGDSIALTYDAGSRITSLDRDGAAGQELSTYNKAEPSRRLHERRDVADDDL